LSYESQYPRLLRAQRLELPQGEKGPYRTATIQSKLNLTQSLLANAVGLEKLIPPRVGKTNGKR
jgi:hypothetical protein